MRVVRCDRCGKDIPIAGERSVGYVSFSWRELHGDDLVDDNPYEKWDFCPECMAEIKACIEKKDPAREAKPRKEKVIDKGKIDALWDAGWSEEMIAAEMKLTEKKVKEILAELGLTEGGLK